MKVIVEYNLEDDQSEFEMFKMAPDMYNLIYEFNNELRKIWKYETLTDDQYQIVEKIRDKWIEILHENKISNL